MARMRRVSDDASKARRRRRNGRTAAGLGAGWALAPVARPIARRMRFGSASSVML